MLNGLDTLSLIADVTSTRGRDELLTKMQAVARSIGFDQVLFAIQMHLPVIEPVREIISGYPLEYQRRYQAGNFEQADPTVAHCRTSTDSLVWEERIFGETVSSQEVYEEARKYGLQHGVSVPVHESATVVSMLSMGRDKPFDSDAERDMVLAAGKVLANCVHVASENHILPDLLEERRPRLSPREMQCLQLVAIGKSNWDIGEILHISEATAAFHVQNVLKKLKVSSRPQATAIGVALRMITW